MNEAFSYPWYRVDRFDDLMQGDVILHCPLVRPHFDSIRPYLTNSSPLPSTNTESAQPEETPKSPIFFSNVVIVSQSCDLANRKCSQVLVCACQDAITFCPEKRKREDIAKGRSPAQHIIEKCQEEGVRFQQQIVDFREVYSLPFDLLLAIAMQAEYRARLLPPYREHLAQAFARYFMRVGLPINLEVE